MVGFSFPSPQSQGFISGPPPPCEDVLPVQPISSRQPPVIGKSQHLGELVVISQSVRSRTVVSLEVIYVSLTQIGM